MSYKTDFSATLLFLSALTFFFVTSGFNVKNFNAQRHTDQLICIKDTLPENNDLKIFEKVEVEASFAGGETAWREYLQKNLKANVPVKNKAPVGNYTVVIQFVVDKEGNISDIKALTNRGYGMEKEVIRILKKSPKWTPAYQDNRPVKAYRKQPVTFVVMNG